MLSPKEEKTIGVMDTDSLGLSSPPAIVDEIIDDPIADSCPDGETISIEIPSSSDLGVIDRIRAVEPQCKDSPPDADETGEIGGDLNFESAVNPDEDTRNSADTAIKVEQGRARTIKSETLETISWSSGINQRADKTKGCPYPSCSRYGRAFSRAHDLKRHIARHETRKERFVEEIVVENRACSQCGEIFANEILLQKHSRLHANHLVAESDISSAGGDDSTGSRVYSCGICKKRYTNERKLDAHLGHHAKKSEGNACLLCDSRFEDEDTLQNHLRDHATIVELADEEMVKATDKSTQAMDDDDDDDFMLEEMLLLNKNPRSRGSNGSSRGTAVVASSSSSSGGNNSGAKSNNKIRCDYCSKTFKTKWTLSSHVAAHEGRFQFGCTRCGKKFVRKSHFEGHVRSHEAARPYVCEQCGKTFKELKHRREHTKRKHPGNRNAIQNLLDSISACVSDDSTVEQGKFTLLMPINFGA